MDFDFDTLPNEEAARAIAYKTPLGRKVFDQLLPELKARAFVVSGLEDLRTVAEIRDIIAELPKGEPWEVTAAKVREKLLAGSFSEEAARKRAELLVRHHGFMAYAEADYAVKQATVEDFPYWKYQTMGDHRVRSAHAALDGLVLPANHPFWKDHYPPWEWGCRCQVVAITAEEYAEIKGRVAGSFNPTADEKARGWVLPREVEASLDKAVTLDDGSGHPVDVRSPAVREGKDAFHWHPGESAMRASDLHKRYAAGKGADGERDWDGFYRQMQDETIPDQQGRMRPVWDWVIRDDVRQAAEEARRAAREKGVEVAVTVDYRTGERFGEMKTGRENNVQNGDILMRALKEEVPLSVIHAHTSESIPSSADVLLSLHGSRILKQCVMVTPSGEKHVFREKPGMPEKMRDFWVDMVERWNQHLPGVQWHDALQILKKNGVVDYETTR